MQVVRRHQIPEVLVRSLLGYRQYPQAPRYFFGGGEVVQDYGMPLKKMHVT